MDEKELESLVAQLKAQGLGEEEILDIYYKAFEKGEMSREDLEALANHLGYELDDDFKNDEHPDPIAEGGAEGEGVTKEEAEELKAINPDESKEEFKEKVEEVKEGEPEDKPAEDKKEPEAEEEKSEEEEWEEANKYFRA